MKKKLIISNSIILILILAIILLVFIWYPKPVHFLKGISAKDILRIEVHDGNTGEDFTIQDIEDIEYIISNIQNTIFKREKISIGRMGTRFNLVFYDLHGKKVDGFIMNSYDLIRKDPFFYVDSSGNLCMDYLQNLEDLSVLN